MPATTQAPATGYEPQDPTLKSASRGNVFTFYMYRAMSDSNFPPENVNTANLAGVMWYLQHEVVTVTPRKFGITRIIRLKVQTKATQPLLNRGMNFGVRFAFDSGTCTGPFNCTEAWEKYGYFVGCNSLGDFPYPKEAPYYSGGIWFSLPGECPSRTFKDKDVACSAVEPGGFCHGTPTGRGDCTYTYEKAGEINVDDLEGGDPAGFWASPTDEGSCADRVESARALFISKYPHDPDDLDLPAPRCDFSYGSFYNGM